MNYQRGLNRAFFVFCIVWVFFVLVGVPVAVWNQVLREILSRERGAAKLADLSLMAGESTKLYDEEVKVLAQEYNQYRSFPYFYKKLWGKNGGVTLLVSLADAEGRPEKSPLLPWPPWLRLILVMPIILPMSILEAPPGWLVMPFLMLIPPGVVYGLGWIALTTLRWIVRGFRER